MYHHSHENTYHACLIRKFNWVLIIKHCILLCIFLEEWNEQVMQIMHLNLMKNPLMNKNSIVINNFVLGLTDAGADPGFSDKGGAKEHKVPYGRGAGGSRVLDALSHAIPAWDLFVAFWFKKHNFIVDQNLEGVRACCAPPPSGSPLGWITVLMRSEYHIVWTDNTTLLLTMYSGNSMWRDPISIYLIEHYC